MKGLVFSLLFFVFLTSCGVIDGISAKPSTVTPSVAITEMRLSTVIPSATTTSTPTSTVTNTPTKTPTPTITPTPTPTAIGGGIGKIIGKCEDGTGSIYEFDLASGEYKPVNNLIQSTGKWEVDTYYQLSPSRDSIIWGILTFRDVEIVNQQGEQIITNYDSRSDSFFFSPIDTNGDLRQPYYGEIPDLWLPNDVGLFAEDNRSEDPESKYVDLYLGDFNGENKKYIGSQNP